MRYPFPSFSLGPYRGAHVSVRQRVLSSSEAGASITTACVSHALLCQKPRLVSFCLHSTRVF